MAEIPLSKPPWEGCFHGLSVTLEEFQNEVLKLRVCRSTRADLRHKIEIIIRANGGYKKGGVKNTAKLLKVSRDSVYRWMQWRNTPPNRLTWERIDNQYEIAVDNLAKAELLKRSKKSKI